MGKKKGKKQSGAEEKEEPGKNGEVLEANGDNANLPKKEPAKTKKKGKNDDNWEDDVANEIAQLSVDKNDVKTEEKDPGEDVEFFDPSDDERSKKKKKKKGKQEVRESPEPEEQPGGDLEPEFFVPSDDERTKKKKKSKKKGGDLEEADEQKSKIDDDSKQDEEPEFFDPGDDGKKKKQSDKNLDEAEKTVEGAEPEQEGSTVKTKAQKMAEKKEREKKKKEQKRQQKAKEEVKVKGGEKMEADPGDEKVSEAQDEDSTEKTSKKKKKGKKEKTEPEAKGRKKPGSKMLAAMKEQLQKQKEEEERQQKELEEKERKEEEARQARIQKQEEEKLKKERKKQKEKDRIKRLKAEGRYLTPAQKEAQRKREAYVESLREQGLLPVANKQKPVYKNLKKAIKKEQDEKDEVGEAEEEVAQNENVAEEAENVKEEGMEEDDVADDWEAAFGDSDGEENVEDVPVEENKLDEVEDGDDDESEEEESEESSEEESSSEDELTPRERAEKRIHERKRVNEEKRNTDDLRSPVICVMGHVDTGKTKILDKIRHSHVQDGEAGGITQQIGATFVPIETIREQTSMVKTFQEFDVLLPGLLVIDTPGHESFSNLRSRGSSVCDMAILVVDIMHGLESQTIESINMLKKRKTPFIVALNKVDRLYEWKRGPDSDVINTLKKQKRHVKDEFEERVREIVVEFAKQNLNVKLFHENDDPKEWISMVPTSAHSGDGMGNLIALVMELCQTMLPKRLAYSEELQSTVLEVKAIQGLGTTIDVILTNGRLKCGDTIVLAGVEGPIVSHIKGLLMPQPLKELRVKNPYNKFDQLKAAQGVKILAKDLEKALAGTQLLVANRDDEIDTLKEEVQSEVDKMLRSIKLQERGVFVQASTLGSLEALLEFLKQSKIPYAGIGIGPVHKRDIMKASVMLEHDSQWAVILAFDVKVEREAQELSESLGVKIFTADIIYHLFDAFMQHREDLKKQKQDEFRSIAVFPCKLRIMPNCVFKSRDPIVVGVMVDAGQLRPNTPICIPTREFLNVGYVTSLEFNHKPIEIARTGQEVCIKIEGTPGEPPKMVGRHFEETDILTSKISRESINALKDWFREDMQKTDWQLIIELKKLFEII